MISSTCDAAYEAQRPQSPSTGLGNANAGWSRRGLRRGVPVAATLLAIAAGCSGMADAGRGADPAGPGEEYRPAATTAAENPAATETALGQVAASRYDDLLIDPPPPAGSNCSFLSTMTHIQDSVFQIILNDINGVGLGTAFYIGDGDFLTAAHLVAGRSSARLRNAVADFPATVTASDPGRDVALLRAVEPPSEALQLLNGTDVRPGQVVASVGYPLFEEYRASITGGLVSRLTEDRDFGLLIQTDAPINRGNSGGPLVDQCGRVVGMTVEKWFEAGVDGVAWAIASSSLETALADLRNDQPPESPVTAVNAVSTTPQAVPAASPPTRPQAFLDEVAALFEDYHDQIEAAGRHFDSGSIDAVTQEQILWRLAEDTDHYRNALDSDGYDLGDQGDSCDLARRAYARALGWTSRLAGYRAAQVWSPGTYDAQETEALRKSREIAAEAAAHHSDCAGDR